MNNTSPYLRTSVLSYGKLRVTVISRHTLRHIARVAGIVRACGLPLHSPDERRLSRLCAQPGRQVIGEKPRSAKAAICATSSLSEFAIPYSLNPGGALKPPISLLGKEANSIGVASSPKGPMIWIPTGKPDAFSPTGATVAGQPVSVAVTIHGMSCMYDRSPSGVFTMREVISPLCS